MRRTRLYNADYTYRSRAPYQKNMCQQRKIVSRIWASPESSAAQVYRPCAKREGAPRLLAVQA